MRHIHRLPRLLAITALLVALPAGGAAQDASLALEVLGAAAIPTGTFASGTGVGEGTGTGASVGVLLTMTGRSRRTTYVGFSQHRFSCQEAGCPSGEAYVATGVQAGLRVRLVQGGALRPWVSFGGLTTKVETPGATGSSAGVSKLGYGGEAGAGLYIGAGHAVAVNPNVRYSAVAVDMPGGSRLNMRYFVAGLTLVLAF